MREEKGFNYQFVKEQAKHELIMGEYEQSLKT
jgi:hypothetical protein